MIGRRTFVKLSALGSLFAGKLMSGPGARTGPVGNGRLGSSGRAVRKPVVVSTWNHGLPANEAAWEILTTGGRALDAVEAAAQVPEADPASQTVGYGGFPDRTGRVTLDACIMDEHGDAGSVAFLQHIMHPISVARLVMEETPHVMLVGEGALRFAVERGFERVDLLTPESEEAWHSWLEEQPEDVRARINVENEPVGGEHNHDTIGVLALDADGRLSGACTTSGAAWKLHGRVGDSPIIGAGLYVDNEVGAACATGWGEAVIRAVGSHLVVELMRQGHSPQEACRLATERVIAKNPDYRDIQVGFLALDRHGEHGAYSIQPGFNIAVYDGTDGNRMIDAVSRFGSSD